ncbi:MAG: FHA domain-containing protein [Myxococcaceae bacterium]
MSVPTSSHYPYIPVDGQTARTLETFSGAVLMFEAPAPILARIPTLTHNTDSTLQRPASNRQVIAPLSRRFSLPTQPFVLGRGVRSDVVLPFETVSRTHAFIDERTPGEYLIYDNHSRNGVILNGELLPPDQWVSLPDDAMLMFGELEISFLVKESLLAELNAELKAAR